MEVVILGLVAIAALAIWSISVTSKNRALERARVAKERYWQSMRLDTWVTPSDFAQISYRCAYSTGRVHLVEPVGFSVTIHVNSQTGASQWSATIDFSDAGGLTGRYRISQDNSKSVLPDHIAQRMQAEILHLAQQRKAG